MDMAMWQGAISSLKVAGDIAIGFNKLKTMAEVQGKAVELQQVILSAQSGALAAQSAQFELIERIRELEKEIADAKAWEETRQRYELHEPNPGTFVYRLKAQGGTSEPAHWACANCYESARRSILQLARTHHMVDTYICPACKAEVRTKGTRTGLGMA